VAINASFTDTLPAGLVVAATPNVVNNCGGSVTAAAGATSIGFSNSSSLVVGTCTILINVTPAVDNAYSNSVTINSSDAGNGNTATASLTVTNPPAIAKAFSPTSILSNGTSSLTLTLSSTNANLTLNGVAFTDALPAGLIVATPSALNNTCNGTAVAAAGSGMASLTGATLAPGASCTITLNVQGTTAGVKNNTTQVSSTNGGTGNTANASLMVVGPPSLTKSFEFIGITTISTVAINTQVPLVFRVTNSNPSTALSGISFSDTLPAGLIVSTPNGLSNGPSGTTPCTGTITAVQATNSISLSGATLAANTTCTFQLEVTATQTGNQVNTTSSVTSNEGGTGAAATASILVPAPAALSAAFNPAAIPLNGTTTLTFTVTNPAANTMALTGAEFSDTLPTGLTVANGFVTSSANCPVLQTQAPNSITTFAPGTVPANGSCVFTVTVTGAASGQYTNTTTAVMSSGGTGNTATANLTVASPPTISKTFGALAIPMNGITSLTFTITNPNSSTALTGVVFTDNLPAGLVVATPSNLSNTCGGTAAATTGSATVSLSGATLAAGASCSLSLNVQGATAGVKNNSVQVSSANAGAGNTSSASITVVAPPVLSKAFGPGVASVPLGGSTNLSFTIQNPNAAATLNGISFTDTLPAGLVISTPNGLLGTCGTITATQGTNVISMTGLSLSPGAMCGFGVSVTGTVAGAQNNTTGAVTSIEGGTGATASASIAVLAPPVVAKAFNPAGIGIGANTTLTFTITNPSANTLALTGIALTDNRGQQRAATPTPQIL
jgi:hypothetical protein